MKKIITVLSTALFMITSANACTSMNFDGEIEKIHNCIQNKKFQKAVEQADSIYQNISNEWSHFLGPLHVKIKFMEHYKSDALNSLNAAHKNISTLCYGENKTEIKENTQDFLEKTLENIFSLIERMESKKLK